MDGINNRIVEVPIRHPMDSAIVVEKEPSTDDFLKALWIADRELKIQAYRLLRGENSLASSPTVVKRIQFEKMYTSHEVCEITGLHRNTIGKATRSGKLRATRRGAHTPYLYPESAVRDWMQWSETNKDGESVKSDREGEKYE